MSSVVWWLSGGQDGRLSELFSAVMCHNATSCWSRSRCSSHKNSPLRSSQLRCCRTIHMELFQYCYAAVTFHPCSAAMWKLNCSSEHIIARLVTRVLRYVSICNKIRHILLYTCKLYHYEVKMCDWFQIVVIKHNYYDSCVNFQHTSSTYLHSYVLCHCLLTKWSL